MKKRLKLALLVLPVIVLAAAFFFVVKPRLAARSKSHNEKPGKATELPVVSALDDLTVNLADQGRQRYLKACISLEFASEEDSKKIERLKSQVKDAAIAVLTTHHFARLQTPAGKERLRRELLDSVNRALKPAGVTPSRILFTCFVME